MSSTDAQLSDAVETVELDDLPGSRAREDYQQLVVDTARLVDDGLFAITEVRPDGLVADGQEPSETFVQRFQDDVEAELEDIGSDVTEPPEATREPRQTTSDPKKIDWPKLWVNAGVAATKPQSWTQAGLAIDVSHQTPLTGEGARGLIEAAIEAGELESFPERKRVRPVGDRK